MQMFLNMIRDMVSTLDILYIIQYNINLYRKYLNKIGEWLVLI